MELHQLRYFVTIAHEGTITRAAEALFLAQPSLSTQLKRLEDELGAKLFERAGRKLILTPAGEVFLGHAEGILQGVQRSRRLVSEAVERQHGLLRIGIVPTAATYLLPRLVSDFAAQNPGVHLRITEVPELLALSGMLWASLVDVIVAPLPISSGQYAGQTLVRERIVLVVPPDHHLVGRNKVVLAEVRDERFIALAPGIGLQSRIAELCRRGGLAPNVVVETSQIALVLQMVLAGHGIAILPELAVQEPAWAIEIDLPEATRELAVIWLTASAPTRLVEAFSTLIGTIARTR